MSLYFIRRPRRAFLSRFGTCALLGFQGRAFRFNRTVFTLTASRWRSRGVWAASLTWRASLTIQDLLPWHIHSKCRTVVISFSVTIRRTRWIVGFGDRCRAGLFWEK